MTEPKGTPPRLSISPTRPNPGWILLAVIESLRTFVVAFVALVFSSRERGAAAIAVGALLIGAAIVIWRFLQWRMLSYEAVDRTITMRSGLVEKSTRSLQVERIQSVDTHETPLGRLLGIQEVHLTSAAAGPPIVVPALKSREIDELKIWIDAHQGGLDAAEAKEGDPHSELSASAEFPKWTLSHREVVLAGMTSGRIAPAIALIAAGWRLFGDVVPDEVWERLPIDPNRLELSTVVFVLGVAAILAWAFSILGAVMAHWNFTVHRSGDNLVVSSGLLDRRQHTVPIRRIQAISMVEGVLRQPFGFASLMVESAAGVHGADQGGEVRSMLPFVPTRSVPKVMDALLPEFAWSPEAVAWHTLPSRAMARYIVPSIRSFLVTQALICFALFVIPSVEWWLGLVFLPALPLWMLFAYLQYRDAGWSLGEDHQLLLRHRTLDRRLVITRGRSVHIREIGSNPLQRRASLASITLRLATVGSGGVITLRHVDRTEGQALMTSLE